MPPFMSFFGPDNVSQIKAIDGSGTEVARFGVQSGRKSSFDISRLAGPGTAPIPICTTVHSSSFSSTMRFSVNGQEVEFRSSREGMQTVYELSATMGKMKWSIPSGSYSGQKWELVDKAKQVVAFGNMKEMRLDILVPADAVMLDCLLAGWIALLKAEEGDEDQFKMGTKIMGALGGGGG